jgi:serine/threonine protein kinase
VDEANGTPFGRYRLVTLLGRGGMGEVWRAYDTAIGRVVALKVLPANFADDPVFQERFRREAHSAAQLNEPHVVPIYDFGEIDGRLYVTMRLIDGRDLQTVLAEGPLSPERAVRIIEQVAQALHAAHMVGLVHRDIKPSNVLIDANDFAYLIDFGIARAAGETGLTSTGATIGTWTYMAPERFQGGVADARADIYALACVLYESLTGQPPFIGQTLERIAVAHMLQPPPHPSGVRKDVSAQMDYVIATGMAKNPDQRYGTAVELARAARDATTVPLQPWVRLGNPSAAPTQLAPTRAAPVPPPPRGPPSPEVKPTPKGPGWRRPRVVIPAVLGVTAALIAGGVFAAVKVSGRHDNKPGPAAAPANTGPFTGTYNADFGPQTDFNGNPQANAKGPRTETWGVRSVCRSTGCVATASRTSEETPVPSPLVFDDVGGEWVAVTTGPGICATGSNPEGWYVITLKPRPDGTLSGEYSVVNSYVCGGERTVTFTRKGDVDLASLRDPAIEPPRVVSPAEALHGRYHETSTYRNGQIQQDDVAGRTDCLRTGDRCMSYLHSPQAADPLVFGSGSWSVDREFDGQCQAGGTTHVKVTEQFALPTPPQDPITLLTGHGHQEQTGPCTLSSDFDIKLERTGD